MARAPRLLVVTGDLTQRARRAQFAAARRFLDRLPFAKLVVPGNHDIAPAYRPLSRLLNPYANYRRFIESPLDASYEDDDLLVLGINTVEPSRWKEGAVSRAQIDWIRERASSARGRCCLVASHHPLVRPEGSRLQPMRGGRDLEVVLAELGVEMALAGHLHEHSSGPSRGVDTRRPVLVVQASTATSTRLRGHENAYNLIRIATDSIRVEVRAWTGVSFGTKSSVSHARFRDPLEERSGPSLTGTRNDAL